jgi:alkylhydroperoxidase family enzyme
LVVTSAPSVTRLRPIRPVIGAGTRVKRRLICAVCSAARCCATCAAAWRDAASASV